MQESGEDKSEFLRNLTGPLPLTLSLSLAPFLSLSLPISLISELNDLFLFVRLKKAESMFRPNVHADSSGCILFVYNCLDLRFYMFVVIQ